MSARSIQPASREVFLSPREAAELVGVSRQTIIAWARQGRLSLAQPGPKSFRFRLSEVEALLTPVGDQGHEDA
jgi:excisionase family DNA binding protein